MVTEIKNTRILLMIAMVFCCMDVMADNNIRDSLFPPKEASVELWDCWRSATSISYDEGEHPTMVRITNDSIYFKYYSQDNDEIGDNCWVRGYIDGDEVTF